MGGDSMDSMDPVTDTAIRLSALRHPAAHAGGSIHIAQHELAALVKAFVAVMSRTGHPGSRPLPAPDGRDRWPRRHPARHVTAWPVAVDLEDGFADWLDTTGRWWRLRADHEGTVRDVFPLGSPIEGSARDLARYADAIAAVLTDAGVDPGPTD